MKQLVQNLRSGEVEVLDVPAPAVRPGFLLVQTSRSLISAGTERSVVEFGRAGYIQKLTQQPERAKKALDKVRTDGVVATLGAAQEQLDRGLPMGYCNVGRVLQVGAGVVGFEAGDLVASNGHHAEIVSVPANLAARVPPGVTDEQAAFTVIGSIALQGVRLVEPTLGESVATFGLGLVGLLAAQILLADGARVIGFDTDPSRVALAESFGIEAIDLSSTVDPVAAGMKFTDGQGLDSVLIAASTKSSDLMHQAAQMSRKRGRVVVTGVTGLNLRRSDFYEKELRFQVSCSYGPGRYDPEYEEKGRDYPLGFVRWTAQRNFATVLDLLRDGRLRVEELVSQRVPVEEAARAYDAITSREVIGVVLEYPTSHATTAPLTRTIAHRPTSRAAGRGVCGVIGAGVFAQAKILPALQRCGARLKWVASSGGTSAAIAARRFGIEKSTTEVDAVLFDPGVDVVIIATRHDSHASLVVRALEAGKSVFVEKPLCITRAELETIEKSYAQAASNGQQPILMVGFNRRFAPLTTDLVSALEGRRDPLAMIFTCNAGPAGSDSWVHDPTIGGGRLVGEACHFIDLLQYLARSRIETVHAIGPEPTPAHGAEHASMALTFEDGSIGQVNYFVNGSKRYPKETLEVFSEGRVLRLDNFRRLRTYGSASKPSTKRLISQDKGHGAEVEAFIDAIRVGRQSPIPFEQITNTTDATFAAIESLIAHGPIAMS